jgi:hypothetical protein
MRRIGIFLIMVALIVGMAGCGGGGYTPPSQNLEIRTWYDLDAVRNNLAGNHTLMNDLDSTTTGYEELASPTANQGKGWEPIGTDRLRFSGTFDGQGYEISDLFINRPDEDDVGLFGWVGKEGIIKDIGVVNFTTIGEDSVGGLVGYNRYGTVKNSYSTGSVTGNDLVGGLVGENQVFSTVSDSYSSANVNGQKSVGGLVGYNDYGTVSNSYSTGSVTGYSAVGGLMGTNLIFSTVNDSYSSANVNGGQNVGGLVGDNWGTVNNSYSTGSVTGDSSVGGLVGANEMVGTVVTSFWDTETSGLEESDGGTGTTTTEMQNIVTFSEAGWDITAVANVGTRNPSFIWNIVNDEIYPFLSWQSVV